MVFNYQQQGSEILLSKYNSAADINQRVGRLWYTCNRLSITGQLEMWNAYLNAVWMEFAADTNNKDKADYNEFDKELKEEEFFTNNKPKPGFTQSNDEEISKKTIYYNILKRKHIFLKEIEKKQGKGAAYRDEFEDDFE